MPVTEPGAIHWQPAPTSAWARGRQGYRVEMIVLYATGRPLADTLAEVLRSFHYVIDKDGTIYQTVQDADAARHSLLSPADLRDTAIRPNFRGLGIALVNLGRSGSSQGDAYTEAQYASLKRLLGQLCQQFHVPRAFPPLGPASFAPVEQLFYFGGILGDSAISGAADSPGPQFDWHKIAE
jgi:N-acetyl-anhydromuramyl-L-alanine amidase AmpD